MSVEERMKLLQKAQSSRETATRARHFAQQSVTAHVVAEFSDIARRLEREADQLETQARTHEPQH